DGTVFKLTPSGGESVIYSFQGSPDGQNPYASLIGMHGALYGTTYGGGTTGCTQFHGCGTIFEITPSGTEEVLYRFQSSPDGSGPWGGVTKMGNKLYGAASTGGNCCGTVFRMSP
ncbi:MAG: choice-of-anchor tandem repeat GloVer-containing protein, partial [Candidatus Cybelea sp.]